jgi:D-3-phosphoglycerate dehydrogenase / 2-oxoglutarate reductase
MIGAEELRGMKPGAFLINNSRGTVVDLDALAAALKAGRLGGAVIDVFPKEPAVGSESFHSPLQGLENVILTRHIGGLTDRAEFQEIAEAELLGLHEVNFARYQIRPSEFKEWQAV